MVRVFDSRRKGSVFEGHRRQTRPLISGMYMKKSLQVAFNKRDAIKTVTNDGD